ncbi:hypothetical protein [Pontibacter ummariensis]|uniref:hypothetical protein n=1 Tax=Pontibacter ummariensis TaxID=1610492 RepID=UPI000B7942C7|nr:hypothetical protein [Pontibacter ummariensis]
MNNHKISQHIEERLPPGVSYDWPGIKVQRVDLSTGQAYDYIYHPSLYRPQRVQAVSRDRHILSALVFLLPPKAFPKCAF